MSLILGGECLRVAASPFFCIASASWRLGLQWFRRVLISTKNRGMKSPDLNLLIHFDALMTCRAVSRAAEQVGVSQPAMSAALSRLRKLFNDPLLIREGTQWQPTPHATALH